MINMIYKAIVNSKLEKVKNNNCYLLELMPLSPQIKLVQSHLLQGLK